MPDMRKWEDLSNAERAARLAAYDASVKKENAQRRLNAAQDAAAAAAAKPATPPKRTGGLLVNIYSLLKNRPTVVDQSIEDAVNNPR